MFVAQDTFDSSSETFEHPSNELALSAKLNGTKVFLGINSFRINIKYFIACPLIQCRVLIKLI